MKREIEKFFETNGTERTVDNVGSWKGEFQGWQIWIGDPNGSRVGKFEVEVRQGLTYTIIRATKFSAIAKKIADIIEGK